MHAKPPGDLIAIIGFKNKLARLSVYFNIVDFEHGTGGVACAADALAVLAVTMGNNHRFAGYLIANRATTTSTLADNFMFRFSQPARPRLLCANRLRHRLWTGSEPAKYNFDAR